MMLDERTTSLLKILNTKCSSGSFKVITSDELISDFPPKYGADGDLIRQMIINLSQQGYLSVRYDRDGEFCLSLTPSGRLFCEEAEKEVKIAKKNAITDLLPYFYNFLSIFAAIFSAGLILKLIGALC